jgi:hypothetical protein
MTHPKNPPPAVKWNRRNNIVFAVGCLLMALARSGLSVAWLGLPRARHIYGVTGVLLIAVATAVAFWPGKRS